MLKAFRSPNLTKTLAAIEASLQGATTATYTTALATREPTTQVVAAAGLVKSIASQINTMVHALGMIRCLPHILEADEVIQYVSLGDANTGKPFDLETNQRIAEFKFFRWQGRSEPARFHALFKDFYGMAEHTTHKTKFLYVLGTEHPKRFLKSGQALETVLKEAKLTDKFRAKYGKQYTMVRDYYLPRKDLVALEDVSEFVPELLPVATGSEPSLT